MSKPMVVTAPCGANAIAAKNFVMQDAGVIKLSDGTAAIGVAMANKDIKNNVGVIKQGVIKFPSANDTYNWGDEVEVAVDGITVQAVGTTNTVVGKVVETKTTTTPDNLVAVYVNFA